MKIRLTESQLKRFIVEAINNVLTEAEKIRPWQGNPLQADVDWGKLRADDEEWNKAHPNNPVDSFERFRNFRKGSMEKAKIDAYQGEISDNARKRAIATKGSEYVTPEEIGDMPDKVREALGEAGLRIGMSGKSFSYGNTKLPPSTMIVNITSSFACPSKDCPLAKSICYAKKIGKLRAATELRDMRNQHTYQYLSIKELLSLLEMYIELAPAKIHDIRISEAGDFESQEQVNLCDKLAGHLKAKYGISTTVYTHATSLDFSGVKNMVINASTPLVRGADRLYLVRPRAFMEKLPETDSVQIRENENTGKKEAFYKCECDCNVCRFCYNTKEQNGEPADMMTHVYVQRH